jgi:MOSC domain-containing protein YiiM
MNAEQEAHMRVVSVNVGLPRTVQWHDRAVTTGIFKQSVAGRVAVQQLNLDGDRQADLTVHGGPEKAVYAYPAEHYDYWRRELPDIELTWAAFGENLTVAGLLEDAISIGDRFRVGTALLAVTQPRVPCYKLGIRFGSDDFVERFLAAGLTGFYFSVLEEGAVAPDDPIELVARDPHGVRVADIIRLYTTDRDDVQALQRAANLEPLAASWRDYFRKRAASIARRRLHAKAQPEP